MFDRLAIYLIKNGDLTPDELRLIEEMAVAKKIRKRHYLLQEGEISATIYFVASGCLRQLRIGENGQEHTMRFAVEDWWVSDFESFHSGKPSKYYIEALEDSELLMFTRSQFEDLVDNIPNFKALIQKLGERNFEVHQARIYANISESAEQRYHNFIKAYPEIYRRIPLHMVASFLGLSRETLSRLRQQH